MDESILKPECPVCFEAYDGEYCLKHVTQCKHVICMSCSKKLDKCPLCRELFPIISGVPADMVDKFEIISQQIHIPRRILMEMVNSAILHDYNVWYANNSIPEDEPSDVSFDRFLGMGGGMRYVEACDSLYEQLQAYLLTSSPVSSDSEDDA